MGSKESEWEIQESPGGQSSNNGKISWLLRLGKKILVSGIVISSAPLVLPPLVAISAIGIACSVPYGVFLVSYACTQSVMSRLLPMPSPESPLLLEYRKAFDNEEEDDWDEKPGGENEVIKGGIDMEREEEELKEDTMGEVEMRLELVDKEEDELDEGHVLQEDAFWKSGAENDEKKSIEEVDGIVEEKGYQEDDGDFLDEEEEMPSQSFEVEFEEIAELKAEQPIILEESSSEQPASEGHGFVVVDEEDKNHNSSIKEETPLEAENFEEDEDVVREIRELLGINGNEDKSQDAKDHNQSLENVDAQTKPTKEIEGTTKGKGKQSMNKNMDEQPGDDIHGFVTTITGDEKERVNVNEETSSEQKNMPAQIVQATDIEKAESVSESKGSSRRNRKKGRNRKVAEDKPAVEKHKVDAEGKLPKVKEGTSKRKQEQPVSKENVGEQPADEVSGGLDGLDRSEKNDNHREEMPLEETNLPAHLVQAINVEENERLMTGARGSSEKVRDESKMDTWQRADRVNVGGIGNQSKEIEIKIDGKTEVKVEQCIQDECMSKQSIEEVSNIVVEFEGGTKNASKIEKEIPFHMKIATVQLSQSTDIEEDKELVRETRGLLEKIRDEGKADYAVDSKLSTKKEPVGAEKDNEKIVGDVEKAKRIGARAHDRGGKPTKKFEPKGEELKADKKVQMAESRGNVDVVSEEMKVIEGLSENMDVDDMSSVGQVSETVNDGSGSKEAIFSNEGEREMNGEQLDLLEDLSTVSQQGSTSDMNTLEESQPSSSYSVHQETSDSSELPVSTKAEESDDIPISAGSVIDTASNEQSLYSKEKIWEQIEALRTIIGYKAARQEKSIEELKALYLFTGIEPPASFKDTSDPVEVNAKLRFLMSVIGVK